LGRGRHWKGVDIGNHPIDCGLEGISYIAFNIAYAPSLLVVGINVKKLSHEISISDCTEFNIQWRHLSIAI
jgi:hypothetical protein